MFLTINFLMFVLKLFVIYIYDMYYHYMITAKNPKSYYLFDKF